MNGEAWLEAEFAIRSPPPVSRERFHTRGLLNPSPSLSPSREGREKKGNSLFSVGVGLRGRGGSSQMVKAGLKMDQQRNIVKVASPGDPPAGRVCQRRGFPEAAKPSSRPITCASFSSRASIAASPATSPAAPHGRSAPLALTAPPTHRWAHPLRDPGFLGVVVFTRTSGRGAIGRGWSKASALQALVPLRLSPLSMVITSRRSKAAWNQAVFSFIFLFLT